MSASIDTVIVTIDDSLGSAKANVARWRAEILDKTKEISALAGSIEDAEKVIIEFESAKTILKRNKAKKP